MNKYLVIIIPVSIFVITLILIDRWISFVVTEETTSSKPKIISYRRGLHSGQFMSKYIKLKCAVAGGDFYGCGNTYTCKGYCTLECTPPICVLEE